MPKIKKTITSKSHRTKPYDIPTNKTNYKSFDEFIREKHETNLTKIYPNHKHKQQDINDIGMGTQLDTKGKNDFTKVNEYLDLYIPELRKKENELYEMIIQEPSIFESLKGYLRNDYLQINSHLDKRNILIYDSGSDDEDVKTASESKICETINLKFINNIDTIFEIITPIETNLKVYRCYQNSQIVEKCANGNIIENMQYLSTSLSLSVAIDYCSGLFRRGNIVQILIPPGSRIIPIIDYNKFIGLVETNNVSESEIILDRRGSLKLIEIIPMESIHSINPIHKINPDFYEDHFTYGNSKDSNTGVDIIPLKRRIRHPQEYVRMTFEYIPPNYDEIKLEKQNNIQPVTNWPTTIFNGLTDYFNARTAGGYFKRIKYANKTTRKPRKKRKTLKK